MGLSVRVRRPRDLNPDARASVSLSSIGGRAEAQVDSRFLRGIGVARLLRTRNELTPYVRFANARVAAQGDYADLDQARAVTQHELPTESLRAITTVNAEVTGLEILDRVKIGLARVGLRSDSQNGVGETAVATSDVALSKVYIDGKELRITLAKKFFAENDTKDKVLRNLNASPDEAPDSAGNIFCTVVDKIEWARGEPRTARLDGHSVVVDDLGTIYFGELLISTSARRLRMVRVVLGSPVGGEMCAADVETNGSYWPA